MKKVQVQCNPHPDAPHGFSRNSSRNSLSKVVCDCERWTPDESPSIARFTQDQADAIAIQCEATYHQPNQFWILTNSELLNVCNAAGKQASDCRTCSHRYVSEGRDRCLPRCTNGDKYQEATKVVLWRTE